MAVKKVAVKKTATKKTAAKNKQPYIYTINGRDYVSDNYTSAEQAKEHALFETDDDDTVEIWQRVNKYEVMRSASLKEVK